MNCKQAKTQLALLIGNDLDPLLAEGVRNHVSQCGDCRQQLRRLSACLEVLQVPMGATGESENGKSENDSLWPKLVSRLASDEPLRKPHRLSGWAPTLAVAAACTAMMWVASRQLAVAPLPLQNEMPAQPVGLPAIPNRTIRDDLKVQPRPSDEQSDILHWHGQSSAPLPVVPVNESR